MSYGEFIILELPLPPHQIQPWLAVIRVHCVDQMLYFLLIRDMSRSAVVPVSSNLVDILELFPCIVDFGGY